MKVTLKADQLWQGTLYPAGETEVPADLAIALGFEPEDSPQSPNPPTPTSETEPAHPDSPALEFINQAGEAADLKPLPGIGDGAAKRLLLHRPEGGYESLEQAIELCPELAKAPYRVDWEAIANWQPDSGVPE